ncbi:O-glucosyltransferase rumi homolog isoform X2 [Leptopilina boulardi]|uniref:O-glucosyltransferase rumi homolog isoform X2 n=1 Tax=Leptopilina boulardi TaxID=63433 RepID=UPI0021F64696|nr:O-glucosyltransferase rumi homolog isoform X2 [Leptopilina boulardi]
MLQKKTINEKEFCFNFYITQKDMWSLYIFLLLILIIQIQSNDYCSLNSEKCGKTHNKYSKASNKYEKYFKAIEIAEKNYVECTKSNCGCYKNVIEEQLAPFKKKGIDEKLIENSRDRGVLYQLIDGHLYREKECMFPSRCAGVEHFILNIIDNISDAEVIINTRDYPQSSKHFGNPLPVFSFSKTSDYHDIMYPAWSFWEGGPAISLYPRGLGRWDQHRISLNNASLETPWESKKELAFFRGSRTSSERDNLILLSREKPNLVDAQYTKNQAWKSKKDTLNLPPAGEVSLESHCAYKYLFNYRGVAASFRHKHLFLCESLVFHVGNEWTEFYYDAMKPWIHYIPVSKDASQSELEELIQFAKDNDEISRKIANQGRDFIWEKLRMKDVTCYWRRLFKKYIKLLTFKPTLKQDLIEIYKK